MLKSVVIIGAALFLIHCGQKDSPAKNSGQVPPEIPSLDGLSAPDTLKTKYDKAELHCQLEVPFQIKLQGVSTQHVGTDSAVWNILSDYSLPRKAQLIAKGGDMTFILDMEIDSVDIENITYQDSANRASYQMQYSPVIKGSYSYKTEKPISLGTSWAAPSGSGPITLYEKIEHSILNNSESAETQDKSASYSMEEHLKCLVDTTSKSQFQNQFSKTEN